jgi:anti-sigma B factor antagonist
MTICTAFWFLNTELPTYRIDSRFSLVPIPMIDFGTYKLKPDDDVLVIALVGQLDTESCDYFFRCLEGEIDNGHVKLIVDCRELQFISSMGLGMLLRAHSRMKQHGGDVKLARVIGTVAKAIQTVQLHKLLNVFPTVSEALEAFG